MMTNADAARTLTVTISAAAALIAGWDDPCLIADMARQWAGRRVTLTGTADTLEYAADVMSDYADAEQCGDGLTGAQRRAARRAEGVIRAAL